MKTVYAVYKPIDLGEGRLPPVLDCLFYEKEEATLFADGQYGIQGLKGFSGGWDVRDVVLYDNAWQRGREVEEDIRKRALNKLTTEEKEVLGLHLVPKIEFEPQGK